ncbi:hypothetical protein [Legionella oakridgensis]|uniref:Uncharacterized protein n=2 Tax=Legionella oakridgensis TaxID=29423 RepID=W0BAG0_9GAMM|nr:hypothetical protein [Legionella oakridgensis]AHE67528.1 hypothetical protein Loa_01983 [Legionella oakridgensis ATCC 33761 = DSM 21215]ETO92911.1 hypothetical protein LOR_84c24350 [Legionella oakridgensis RV-2-2007]KTD37115.1 hypothetical protein Loak_2251 [Legionella oakridgensis]STY20572.1 Uncharacterised protein [Legionella longbeachae]
MKESSNAHNCLWVHRFELLGLILLLIATILTILTANGIGIAAMFLVGLVLCAHKCLCHKTCNVCHSQHLEEDTPPWEDSEALPKKTVGKKETTVKKTTKTQV